MSEDKKEAILSAALSLFGARGFHGTPVPAIAERAGVGAGTIYRYFDSKERLVNAVFQRWKGVVSAAILTGFPFEAPPRKQFAAYWQRMMGFAKEHTEAMLFLEMHHHAPYLDEESLALEQKIIQTAHLYLEQARAAEATKDVPAPILMAIVHGAFVGLVKEAVAGQIDLDPETIAAAEECCWQAIRR